MLTSTAELDRIVTFSVHVENKVPSSGIPTKGN